MRPRPRRVGTLAWAALVVMALLVTAGLALWAYLRDPGRVAAPEDTTRAGSGTAPGMPDGAVGGTTSTVPETIVVQTPPWLREGAPRNATHPLGPDTVGMPGFCVTAEDAPPHFPTLTLDRLLRDRFDELIDRARAGGSADRQRGLRLALTGDDAETGVQLLLGADDRVQDGFDFAVNAALVLAHRALAQRDAGAARSYGRLVVREDPAEALGPLVLALALEQQDDAAASRDELREANRLALDEPAIQLALGVRLAQTAELAEAIGLLDAYLQAEAADDSVRRLRDRAAAKRDAQRGFERIEREQVTLSYPPETLDPRSAGALLDSVVETLVEAAQVLEVPRRPGLAVFLYATREQMRSTICATGWTGAAFDGTLSLAHDEWSRPQAGLRVVRHEVMHAALHSVVQGAPLWFDEGLAQHFAGEVSPAHHRSWARMSRDRTYVPFASLEGSFMVIHDGADAGLAYHQSHAMVAFMVEYGGSAAVPAAVATLAAAPPGERVDIVPPELTGDTLLDYVSLRLERAGR